ncbi:MAG: ABC transporter permease [Candidatus Obscuribacterales bacterium]|nr:ABC transporter permease [Candidatus Obscuribacterales bacterium]
MYVLALKMLCRDRIKFLTLIVGIAFATLLITQQGSIFCGLMLRTASTIFDTNVPIWVTDPEVRSINDSVAMKEDVLQRVRSVNGVEWAVPFSMNNAIAQSDKGETGVVQLIGLDDESLIGAPAEIPKAVLKRLNEPDAVIITRSRSENFGAPMEGDTFEINDRRARVVGVVDASKNFTPFPSLYSTHSKALLFLPPGYKYLNFVLVKPKSGIDPARVCRNIQESTGLQAFQQWDFVWKTMIYWGKNTGIPINFGITVLLGIIVGAAITAQTLYTFMIENIRQLGTFKAIGISNWQLASMVMLQGLSVGLIGFGIGAGLCSVVGLINPRNSELAYYTPQELVIMALGVVLTFCVLSSLLSIRKVVTVDPALVFRG